MDEAASAPTAEPIVLGDGGPLVVSAPTTLSPPGSTVGASVVDSGSGIGSSVGLAIGTSVGLEVGSGAGLGVGSRVGLGVGSFVGLEVGSGVGLRVGSGGVGDGGVSDGQAGNKLLHDRTASKSQDILEQSQNMS